MYCLRIALFGLWVGATVPAVNFLIDGRYIIGGILAAISVAILGFEALAGSLSRGSEP